MKTNTLKKTTTTLDALVAAAIVFTLATIRNAPMLHMIGGIVLALLAIASGILHIVNFAKWCPTSTRSERLLLLVNVTYVALWIASLVLGAAVFANGAEITRALRDANPAIWAMSRAHIATAVMATILTLAHIVRHIVRFVKLGTSGKQAVKNEAE